MTMEITIESHEDDSVTLRVGGITAHITAGNWRDANDAAHALGAHVAGQHELAALRLRLSGMRSVVEDVERSLSASQHYMRELVNSVSTPSPKKSDPKDTR